MPKGGSIILKIYFSLVSFVTLMMLIFSVSDLINNLLKTYVFTAADDVEWATYCDRIMLKENEMETEEQAEIRCKEQEAREEKASQVRKQQAMVRDISLLVVSAPLFALHFRIVYRDWKSEKKNA